MKSKEAQVTLVFEELAPQTLKFTLDNKRSDIIVSLDDKILFRIPLDTLQAVINDFTDQQTLAP